MSVYLHVSLRRSYWTVNWIIILVFFISMNYTRVNRAGRHLYECFITCFRKSTFINIYWKHLLIKSIIYCWTTRAFGLFTYLFMQVCCKKCFSGFSALILTCNILFRWIPNRNFRFSSASLSLVRDNSLVLELEWWQLKIELHLNATYA